LCMPQHRSEAGKCCFGFFKIPNNDRATNPRTIEW
jgi:hypothetical protein